MTDDNNRIDGCTTVIGSGGANPDELATSYYNRGTAYLHKGQLALAALDFSKVLEIHPNDDKVLAQRGQAYARMGKHDLAIQDLSQAITLNRADPRHFFNRGHVYLALRLFDRAIQDFTQTIQLQSSEADAFNNRGVAYAEKGLYDQAFSDFTQAILISRPDNAAFYLNRMMLSIRRGESARGFQDVRKADQLDHKLTQEILNGTTGFIIIRW